MAFSAGGDKSKRVEKFGGVGGSPFRCSLLLFQATLVLGAGPHTTALDVNRFQKQYL